MPPERPKAPEQRDSGSDCPAADQDGCEHGGRPAAGTARTDDPAEHGRRLFEMLRAIRKVNQLITREDDRDRLIEGACDILTGELSYHDVWIALLDGERTAAVATATRTPDDRITELRERLLTDELPPCARRALATDGVVVVGDPARLCPGCPMATGYQGRSGLARRLAFDGADYGVLTASAPAAWAEDPEEQGLFDELAGDLGFALHRIARLEQEQAARTELCASEARLRSYLEHAPHGVFIADREGHYVEVNPAAARITGYSEAQLLTMSIPDLLPPASRQAGLDHFRQVFETGAATGELPFRHAGGEIRSWSVSATRLDDDRFLGFVEDVTDRARREERIALLGRMLDEAPASITVHDDSGRFLYTNRQTLRLHGYATADEFLEVDLHELDVPESAALLEERFREIAERGEARFEVAHFRTDGTTFPLEVHARKIDWHGRPAVLSVATDISERVLAEAELAHSRDLMRYVIEHANAAVAVHDRDLRYLYVSQRYLDQYGIGDRDIIGRHHYEVFPDLPEKWREVHRRVLAGSTEAADRDPYPRSDGAVDWTRWQCRPWHEADGAIGGLIVYTEVITARVLAEQALRASESRFRGLVEQAQAGIWSIDPDGITTYVNPRMAEMLGYLADEMTGRHFFDFMDEAARSTAAAKLARRRAGVAETHPFEFLRRDGSRIVTSLSTSPIQSPDGDYLGATAIAIDLTESARIEKLLSDSRHDLQRAQSIAEIGSWRFDLASGDVVASDEARRIYGFGDAPWTIEAVQSVPLLRYREMLDATLDGLVTDGTPYDVEFEIQRASDGAVRHIRSIAEFDPERNVVVGTIQDITERKLAEKELRDSEQRYRGLFENAQDAFYEVTPDGIILDVSPSVEQLSGHRYRRDELIGRSLFELYAEPAARDSLLAELHERGAVSDYEIALRTPDGDTVECSISARIHHDADGRPDRIIGSLRNISERKRLEAQLSQAQKMESIGRLAGGVAHDFNNQLNVILGHAELALGGLGDDAEIRSDLEEIEAAARHSADLTGQLLAYARKQTIAPRVLDLNLTVEATLRMLRRLVTENIDLVWKPEIGLDPVRLDPAQVDQILANLVVNARDAIGHDPGTITIETGGATIDEATCSDHAGFAPGDYVVLAVSDDGRGMDADTRSKIFEPFFTTKGVGEGTGLGLATVYGIVKQNQGFINVYSEPGRGSTFRIYLPAHAGSRTTKKNRAAVPSPSGGETILVVEDEPAILALSARMLDRLGYHALTAATPGKAVELAERHAGAIDLLITDVVMPEMNGRDLARRLLSVCPGMRLLFMSGYTADVIAQQGVLDDGVHFIQKPFSMQEFAIGIGQALERPAETSPGGDRA